MKSKLLKTAESEVAIAFADYINKNYEKYLNKWVGQGWFEKVGDTFTTEQLYEKFKLLAEN